jgi:hypothetical protein
MNDNDLDELLDRWTAPAPPPHMRNRLRAEFRARNSWPRRLRGLAITLLAAAALFALIGNAISQTPSPIPAPWTAESEFIRYAPNGSSSIEMTTISYPRAGIEVLLSRSNPQNPLATVLYRAGDVALPAMGRAIQRAFGPPSVAGSFTMRAFGYVTGCADDPLTGCLQTAHYYFLKKPDTCIDGSVVGEQTLLNHQAIGVLAQMGDSKRETFWLAPDLGCFALKIDIENRLPGGAFHLTEEKRVVRITAQPVNAPQ